MNTIMKENARRVRENEKKEELRRQEMTDAIEEELKDDTTVSIRRVAFTGPAEQQGTAQEILSNFMNWSAEAMQSAAAEEIPSGEYPDYDRVFHLDGISLYLSDSPTVYWIIVLENEACTRLGRSSIMRLAEKLYDEPEGAYCVLLEASLEYTRHTDFFISRVQKALREGHLKPINNQGTPAINRSGCMQLTGAVNNRARVTVEDNPFAHNPGQQEKRLRVEAALADFQADSVMQYTLSEYEDDVNRTLSSFILENAGLPLKKSRSRRGRTMTPLSSETMEFSLAFSTEKNRRRRIKYRTSGEFSETNPVSSTGQGTVDVQPYYSSDIYTEAPELS